MKLLIALKYEEESYLPSLVLFIREVKCFFVPNATDMSEYSLTQLRDYHTVTGNSIVKNTSSIIDIAVAREIVL
jgi:hypothetical protein